MKFLIHEKTEDTKTILVESYESDCGFRTDDMTYLVDSVVNVVDSSEIYDYMDILQKNESIKEKDINGIHDFIMGDDLGHVIEYSYYTQYITITFLKI